MANRSRFFAFSFLGLATVLLTGVSVAAARADSSVSSAPVAEHVPQGTPLSDDPSVDELLDRVRATTEPGISRDRLELATRQAEIGPGGSSAMPGIEGIAASADGILIALRPDASLEAVESSVATRIEAVLAEHPALRGFGPVTFEVRDLTVMEQSTPG